MILSLKPLRYDNASIFFLFCWALNLLSPALSALDSHFDEIRLNFFCLFSRQVMYICSDGDTIFDNMFKRYKSLRHQLGWGFLFASIHVYYGASHLLCHGTIADHHDYSRCWEVPKPPAYRRFLLPLSLSRPFFTHISHIHIVLNLRPNEIQIQFLNFIIVLLHKSPKLWYFFTLHCFLTAIF